MHNFAEQIQKLKLALGLYIENVFFTFVLKPYICLWGLVS